MTQETTGQFARLIRSDAEYEEVVNEIERLLDENPKEGSAADERIEFLSLLVEDYDRKHNELPGPEPTPQEVVEFMLDVHGMDKADLSEVMGGRSRVSEFFSGKRLLSMSQVYALRDLLKISADLLLGHTGAVKNAPAKAPARRNVPRLVRESLQSYKIYDPKVRDRDTRETLIKRASVHVVPSPTRPGKFVVQVRGKVLTKPITRKDAIARAISLARNNNTSIAIHSPSGQITTKNVSKDPHLPRNRRG